MTVQRDWRGGFASVQPATGGLGKTMTYEERPLVLLDPQAQMLPWHPKAPNLRIGVVSIDELLSEVRQPGRQGGMLARRIWRPRITSLLSSRDLLIIGPIDKIFLGAKDDATRNEQRRQQQILCNLLNFFPNRPRKVILHSCARLVDLNIQVPLLKSKLFESIYFNSPLDTESFISQEINQFEGAAVDFPRIIMEHVRTAALEILSSNHHASSKLNKGNNSDIALAIAESSVTRISKEISQLLRPLDVIDPETNLALPPAPRPRYDARYRASTSHNAPQFLSQIWADYLGARLLYSGHLKKVDSSLYNAIVYLARSVARGRAEDARTEWNATQTAIILFEKYGMITEHQIQNPPKGLERQIDLIRQSIDRQYEPILARLRGVADSCERSSHGSIRTAD